MLAKFAAGLLPPSLCVYFKMHFGLGPKCFIAVGSF